MGFRKKHYVFDEKPMEFGVFGILISNLRWEKIKIVEYTFYHVKVCILIIPKNIINTQRGPVVGVRLNRLQNLTETLGKSRILLHITVTILADVVKQEGCTEYCASYLTSHEFLINCLRICLCSWWSRKILFSFVIVMLEKHTHTHTHER